MPLAENVPHRHRVLLVEDDLDSRDVVETLLNRRDFAVFPAGDGVEALGRLHEGARPCVIVLEWRLPRLDGSGFRRAQLADPLAARIPVLALSAYRDAGREVASLGIREFLAKPFDPAHLLRTIERMCTHESGVVTY